MRKRLVEILRKGTMGIVGISPRQVADLNLSLVKYGNSIGLKNDQEFPETFAVGMKTRTFGQLLYQGDMCADFGCDSVVVAGDCDSETGQILQNRFPNKKLSVFFKEGAESHDSFVKRVFDFVKEVRAPRRPNLYFNSQEVSEEEFEEIKKNLKHDRINREKRIESRKNDHGGYPFMNGEKVVGVIGGAGPLASAEFCKKLSETATPFIHYSQNSAPGKHHFEINKGHSYIPHYKNAVHFFESIGTKF